MNNNNISPMKRIKIFLIIASIFIISSCAGLGIFSGAKHEFDQGLALFNRGRYEEAIPHFEKATEIDPDFAKAHLYLGRSHLHLGKWLNALGPLRTALRLSPTESRKQVIDILLDALFGAASNELKRGNFPKAIGFFKEILEFQPQSDRGTKELLGALMGYGGKLLSEGNAAEAIGAFSEAVKLSPHNLDAYLGLARAFFKSGNFAQALQTAKDAMKIDPTNKDFQFLFRELMRQ
jgi:tetratricopeptide (TPR) repeat protein